MTRPLKIFAETIAVILVLCAIALGVTRSLLLPHIDRYKPYLENWVSSALQQTVKVEKIQAIWQGLHPEIEMDNVRIFDNHGVQHLYVKRLQLGIKLIPSLIYKKIIPTSLLIANTYLQVRRIDENTLFINGFLVPVKESAPNSTIKTGVVIAWLLEQGQIKLENIDVDFQTQDGQLFQITNASVQLKRGLFKDQLIGIATLFGKENARFRFVANIKQTDRIHADCYLYLQNLDLTTLNIARYFPNLNVIQGHLNHLQVWGTWQSGYWQQIQATLESSQTVLENKTFLSQPLQLNKLDANLFWEPEHNGFNVMADKVNLIVNQQVWPLTQVRLVETRHKESHQVTQHLQMDALDLAKLRALVTQSNIAADAIELLAATKPQGMLKNIVVTRENIPIPYQAAHDSFFINTEFQALNTAAWHQIPAVAGLQGRLYIGPNKGNLQLTGKELQLNFPAYFDHPLNFKDYAGQLEWVKSRDGFTLQTKNFAFSDANLAASMQFTLFLPDQHQSSVILAEQSNGASSGSPYLKLEASFLEQGAGQLKNYVPTVALHDHVLLSDWLRNAFVSSASVSGKVHFQGMMSHFPFDDHTGNFDASVHTNNLQFNYKPEWPQVFNLNADAVFHNRQLAVQVSDASILNTHTGPIQANITNLAHAELDILGQLQTNMQTGLAFIQQTPLQKTIGEGLDKLVLDGAIKLGLQLHIPLYKDAPPPKIKGDVSILPPAKLDIPNVGVHLTNLQGAFTFTQNTLLADQMSAQWLNQPINIGINTSADSAGNHIILVKANGRMSMSALQKTYGLDFLKDKISGSADYQSVLKISNQDGHSHAEFDVDSDLKGMAIQLPDPLKKQANDKRDMHVSVKIINQSGLSIFSQYAKLLTTTIALVKNQQNNWYFKQGNFQFGQIPRQTFSAAQIIVKPQSNNWLVQITSPTILGKLTIPSKLNMPITGDFDRFRLVSGTSTAATQMNPGTIPPLNFMIRNFSYEDKPFGRFYLRTAAATNLLQIQQLNIDMGDTHLAATGQWQQISKGRQQTTLSGNMSTKNLGAVLKSWQLTNSLLEGDGAIAFALAWPAAANDFSVQQLNGDFSLAFKKGRIINISESKEAKLGIGRILNLLSLRSIPRRLSLDFGDLLEKGFGFDDMKGNFSMQNGTVMTQNAYLKGPIAKVEIKGKIGAVNRSYDLNMQITPYVTGSLPIAAAILGGPVIGVATWLGSKVLSGVVNKMVRKAYRITGTWDNPVIQSAS